MGWASYLEDILNRLGDDLRDLRMQLGREGWSVRREAEARSLLRRCEDLVRELIANWSYATDPQLDLAHELSQAIRRRDSAVAELRRAEEEISALRTELANTKKLVRAADKALSSLKRERRKLLEKFDLDFDLDPGRIYDKYPPTGKDLRDKQ